MGELNSIQDVFDWLRTSTTFWVLVGIAGALAVLSLLRGGRR